MVAEIGAAFVVVMGIIGWIYEGIIRPPPPKKLCGSEKDPTILMSSPRIRLNDGRHLAYKELGVSKEEAQYKVILCHGLDSCKDMDLPISQVTSSLFSLLPFSLFLLKKYTFLS